MISEKTQAVMGNAYDFGLGNWEVVSFTEINTSSDPSEDRRAAWNSQANVR